MIDTAAGQVVINNGGANTGRVDTRNGAVNITGVDLDLNGATATIDAGMGDIEQQARAEGMRTMFEDGLVKSLGGSTTIEEVLRVTQEG